MKNLFFLALFILFAGCTVDEQGVDIASVDADECEESGGLHCSADGSTVDLELNIKTGNPIDTRSANGDCDGDNNRDFAGDLLTGTDIYCFDVSGTCNEAGLDLASVIAKTSLDDFNASFNLGSCKRGKFHVQLRVQLLPGDLCRLHTLKLELIGKKADGTEVIQPAKARDEVGFKVSNHENCT
ncbi:MAG: hypothetical protein ACRBBP_06565 [Bdellovibrionales bacterium]